MAINPANLSHLANLSAQSLGQHLGQNGASNASNASNAAPAPASFRFEGLAESSPVGFGQVVSELLNDVNQQQVKADTAVEDLISGRTDNVHDVVLTAVKADLSVRMLLEIRNQLVSSYQELMRMQL